MLNKYFITSLLGLIAFIFVGIGEYFLHFDLLVMLIGIFILFIRVTNKRVCGVE